MEDRFTLREVKLWMEVTGPWYHSASQLVTGPPEECDISPNMEADLKELAEAASLPQSLQPAKSFLEESQAARPHLSPSTPCTM